MITKIIRHNIRSGLLAFFLGLFISLGALYIDAVRDDTSGTIGLYQVVGALTGYTLSGIGVILIMKATKPRKAIQSSLLYGGGIIVAISVMADYIGIAGAPGFDKFQGVGIVVGVIILAIGVFVRPQIITRLPAIYEASDNDE